MAGSGGSAPPVFIPLPSAGLGYGGEEYSYSPYGSGAFPRQPISPDGGYGGASYGTSSYGSVDITPPRVSSALSLDGYRIEVFFSEEMEPNAALFDPANYTLFDNLGAPATVTSVAGGTEGPEGGCTSMVITHSGTTLAGTYVVRVNNVEDLSGNPIDDLPPPSNEATVLTLGDVPTVTITPTAGDTLQFSYTRSIGGSQDMLTETDFSPGIEDISQYEITTSYPINLTIESIAHPVGGDASLADMTVSSMTSALYNYTVGPADSILYDGSFLPDTATEFNGVELGTGTSSANATTNLRLDKDSGNFYGWDWQDTSGRLLPGSSYRADFSVDATTAVYVPALFDTTLGTYIFNDGAVEITFTFTRSAGVDLINITSGAYSASIPATWSSQPTTITVVRNQKAEHFGILINDEPVISQALTAFTGAPSISPGARFLLASTYDIEGFTVSDLNVTSSQTLFTSAWNFLHSISGTFTGSAALANDRINTKRGPLVKGWGDATLATENDVTVRVNGTTVQVSRVNPYTGTIFPTVPIPLAAPGTNTIDIDYKWFPNPKLAMAGLNTPGLVLNKWDHHNGHTDGAVSGTTGVASGQRFPMALALAPTTRPQPIYIGHRYLGYERKFSALLNKPTTLLLNQDPHRVSVDPFQSSCQSDFALFGGNSDPTQAELSWELDGTDTGGVVGDGTYRLIDASAGTYEVGEAAFYFRELDLSCPSVLDLSGRIQVEGYTADGVFTGVGWGFHNNHHLYLVGALVVNGLRHVGLLLDGERPDLPDSWQIGPSTVGTIHTDGTITVPSDELPSSVEDGSQFQIPSGPQAGIYTVSTCGVLVNDDGTTTLLVDEDFPADPALEGNDSATLVFETLWDENPVTLRGVADVEGEAFQVFVGGAFNNPSLFLSEGTTIPPSTSLLIRTGNKGQTFWGSLSRIATNETLWSFYSYNSTPESATSFSRGIVVSSDMGELPQEERDNPWFQTNAFGYSEIDSSGDTLLLKSTSNSETIDLSYGYARIEPFLTSKANVDVDAHFQVETGTLGAGDALIRARDDIREGRLATILYRTVGSTNILLQLNSASLSGLRTPDLAGWTEASGSTVPEVSVRGQTLTLTKSDNEVGFWRKNIEGGNLPLTSVTGRVIEARLRFNSATAGVGDRVGFGFAGDVDGRRVGVSFRTSPDRVILTSTSGTDLATYNFDWDDGEFHTFRVLAESSSGSVVLIVDDAVATTAAFTAFSSSSQDRAVIGGLFSEGSCEVDMDSFHVADLAPSSALRTLGVFLGGDDTDIDNWALPRTDTSGVPNSDATASIEEMDWTSLIKVRLHFDPRWGVSIYRPDLPPPPGYSGGDFATEITDPSAAWINVEYRNLPRHDDMYGSVAWGALDPFALTQQRWRRVAYRVYKTATEDFTAPQGMVLNRANVIHSGEYNTDDTPEVVTVTSLTARVVSIRSAHQNANRIFNVVVDDAVVPSTGWTFDEESQVITLADPLPSDHYPVTVTFSPGKPITETYLCNQPFDQSVTKLNEGTPPVPMSQQQESTREEVFGSRINDPEDVLNTDPDFVLNDPYRTVQFSDGPDALYDCLSFCTVDDDGQEGLLSIACDGPAPEEGWIELSLDGTSGSYHDPFSLEGGPGGPFGSQSPSISGSAKIIDQTHTLMTSGGSFNGGVLAGGVGLETRPPVLHPNAGSGSSDAVVEDRFGLNQETKTTLIYSDPANPLEDMATIPETADNVPPSVAGDVDSNPNGTAGAQLHGAAAAQIVDPGTSDGVSRLGPWGGIDSLEPQSLLAGGTNDPTPGTMFFTLNGGSALPDPTATNFTIEAAN